MAASSRRISVSALPNGVPIYIDITDGKLGLSTLQSQYPHATGLKYRDNRGNWVGVTIEQSNFIIPECEESFLVVTDTVDRARSIMSNNSLAMKVASCFGPSERQMSGNETQLSGKGQQGCISTGMTKCHTSNFQSSNLRQNLSRKQSRTMFQKPKVVKEKVFKVVFMKQMDLPNSYSREMVLSEGFVTIKSNYLEPEIMTELLSLLIKSDIDCSANDVVILTNSSKTLSIPCCSEDFKWSLESLKKNVGQGKLYVMVNGTGNKDGTSDDCIPMLETDSTIPHASNQQKCLFPAEVESPHKPPDELHVHVEAGTPTVLMKMPLSQDPSMTECNARDDSDSDGEILQDISLTVKKRRCLKLKTPCHPDSSLKNNSDSGEDTDLTAAIQASLEDSGNPKEILAKLTSQVDREGSSNLVNVDRYDIMDGARRGFSRKKFKYECKLSIKFSGEYGIDDGGPSKEFMRLTLRAIRDSPIFEGDNNSKMIRPDMPSEERGDYVLFGRMIAYFLVHRGPSPSFFSVLMYNLIAGAPCHPQVSDIMDTETREQLQMIQESEDIKLIELSETVMQTLEYLGGVPLLHQNKKDKLLQVLLEFYVITRVKEVLSQFVDGLSCLGVLRAVRESPRAMSTFFTYQNCPPTAQEIEELFEPVFSDEGSNKYIAELRTQAHWRDFLQDLEEKPEGLQNLLQFVTCLDTAPALGFDPSPKLKFNHPDSENSHDGTPYANTCSNTLTVPVLHSYETFCDRMNLALCFGTFFTNE